MTRVTYDELYTTIRTALVKAGLPDGKAHQCAEVHAQSTCDGVHSHGLNRIPRFIDYVAKGWVRTDVEPTLAACVACAETYDGNFGIGVTNAIFAADRTAEIAGEHGIGMVALRNTTHWMRGGSYGWRLADRGMAALCWTNTESCMPAWGGRDQTIGNNPLVIAVPRAGGHLVLDMAMSQFSYGKLQTARLQGRRLPVAGGWDAEGNLTDDPGAIEATRRILPAGYWKGSGLSIMLDLLSAVLAQGSPTHSIDRIGKGSGTGTNQVFMAFAPARFGGDEFVESLADSVAGSITGAEPDESRRPVRYPGQSTLERRTRSAREGVDVDTAIWEQVRACATE